MNDSTLHSTDPTSPRRSAPLASEASDSPKAKRAGVFALDYLVSFALGG